MYEHVEQMSNLMANRRKLIENMEALLNELDLQQKDFEILNEYFGSEQRMQDIEEDEKGNIPTSLNRGALSEDELYDVICDNRDLMIHMMEIALKGLKA
ncbi:DUF4298 domain-containing protein [Faecalimonas sp.]